MDKPSKQITFSHRELARILVREQGLTTGHWGLCARFGIAAANVESPTPERNDEKQLTPAAIVPLVEVGIQEFPEPNSLTVDASKVKPKRVKQKPAVKKKAAPKKKRAAKPKK